MLKANAWRKEYPSNSKQLSKLRQMHTLDATLLVKLMRYNNIYRRGGMLAKYEVKKVVTGGMISFHIKQLR